MKAMILAAGLGTRLRPLTDDRPKALVEVAGHTMLELTLARLRAFGVSDVIVNTHHFAEIVESYLEANRNFGMRIEVSREDELLDIGGGLKRAAWFFREEGARAEQPFLVHNVDVMSTIDLARMIRFHQEQNALATLAVQNRATSRPLLFDESGQFRGRAAGQGVPQKAKAAEPRHQNAPQTGIRALAFSGIHVISPRIFDEIEEQGAFSIIASYVRLAAQGQRIVAFDADGYYWRDLGRPESVKAAARDFAEGTYAL